MRIRTLFLALAVLVAAAPAASQQKPVRLDLNIPALRLDVYEGDDLLRSYPVAVGLPGFDTPDGEFEMTHAEWNPWWRPPAREWAKNEKVTPPGPRNPMGRVKLFFAPYYFIHGTPESESIGSPASHGCVRMRNADVIALSRLLHARATKVSDKEIDRIVGSPKATRHVRFNAPIALTIRYEPVVIEDGKLRVYPDFYKRNRVHAESVYQALIAAGYDPQRIDRAQVRGLLERAKKQKGVLTAEIGEVLASAENDAAPAAAR